MSIIYIATRGSALALVQANYILGRCSEVFPEKTFELKIIKTTGDKLQTAAMTNPNQQLAKGLFTKELEVALLAGEATLAVHSLKDLPTELPEGLILGATTVREDVRDVLIYLDARMDAVRGLQPGARLSDFRHGATIATSSTRRAAQILAVRADLKTVPIRGNVGTRLQKLVTQEELDGIVLALAGLKRLGFVIEPREVGDGNFTTETQRAQSGEGGERGLSGVLRGRGVPEGLLAVTLPVEEMLPCVGQAALGLEIAENDGFGKELCARLNHTETFAAVTAERAFLAAMGGGCLSPVAALATVEGLHLRMRAVSFQNEQFRRAELVGELKNPTALGRQMAGALR